jgi:hypothetical protein
VELVALDLYEFTELLRDADDALSGQTVLLGEPQHDTSVMP